MCDDLRGAQVLFNQIHSTLARWHASDGERQVLQRQAFAMQARMGRPHIFFTLNCYEGNLFQIAVHCGRTKDVDLDAQPTFDPELLCQLAVEYPAGYALAFTNHVHEFLENIVGFCKEQLAPIKGGGIFGHCKGYTCAIESNGRFFLHLHSLLYIHGLPRTQAEFDDAMHKPAFKEQFKEYVNSIMQQFIAEQNWAQQAPCNGCETNSAPPPVFPLVTVLNTTPSITRIGNGPMKAIPLATTANKQGQRYAAAAPSMECITCKHQYTTAARFEEFLVFFKSLHPTVNFPTSAEVLAEKCQPSPVAWPKKLTEASTGEGVLA